uniref:SUEL-type lectin domain-containing protein n=1 Tax=Maylandia zebra TaxID=106582 RepID=A0A3P9DNG3_9CICH
MLFFLLYWIIKISPWLQFDSMNSSSDEGQVIVVSWAYYGRRDTTTCSDGRPVSQIQNVNCFWPGSMDYVTTSCNGKNSCTVEAKSSEDPCYGIYKYLEWIHLIELQTWLQFMNSSSGEGQVIVVSWVNYGRRDNTTCSHGRPVSQIQNVHCSSPSSAEYVTNRCNWQNNCTVGASNTVFGDPCGGTYKYLEVVYDCQVHNVTCEGSQANLQCGQVIVVSWANYGRRDNTTCPDGNPDHSSADSPLTCIHRCNRQNNCTVGASNTGFGDPCSGTYKYLEVFYTCQGKNLKPLDCIHSCAHKKVIAEKDSII